MLIATLADALMQMPIIVAMLANFTVCFARLIKPFDGLGLAVKLIR